MIIVALLPNTKSHSKCQRSISERKKTLIARREQVTMTKQTEMSKRGTADLELL